MFSSRLILSGGPLSDGGGAVLAASLVGNRHGFLPSKLGNASMFQVFSGVWSRDQSFLHFSLLEALAVELALHALVADLRGPLIAVVSPVWVGQCAGGLAQSAIVLAVLGVDAGSEDLAADLGSLI